MIANTSQELIAQRGPRVAREDRRNVIGIDLRRGFRRFRELQAEQWQRFVTRQPRFTHNDAGVQTTVFDDVGTPRLVLVFGLGRFDEKSRRRFGLSHRRVRPTQLESRDGQINHRPIRRSAEGVIGHRSRRKRRIFRITKMRSVSQSGVAARQYDAPVRQRIAIDLDGSQPVRIADRPVFRRAHEVAQAAVGRLKVLRAEEHSLGPMDGRVRHRVVVCRKNLCEAVSCRPNACETRPRGAEAVRRLRRAGSTVTGDSVYRARSSDQFIEAMRNRQGAKTRRKHWRTLLKKLLVSLASWRLFPS